jgi:hypothetical protein
MYTYEILIHNIFVQVDKSITQNTPTSEAAPLEERRSWPLSVYLPFLSYLKPLSLVPFFPHFKQFHNLKLFHLGGGFVPSSFSNFKWNLLPL